MHPSGQGSRPYFNGCRHIPDPTSTFGRWNWPEWIPNSSSSTNVFSAFCWILVLPSCGVDGCARGGACFEDRYGFLSKPLQIRFRLLDSSLYLHGLSDLQIPAHDFSRLHLDVQKVFITENDINGLAFPDVTKAMVIFGLGYGFDRLAKSDWLHDKEIYYWGDIDTHGFAMLDQFRGLFPQTDSILMDEATLMDHRPLWGQEQSPTGRELKRLKAPEERLYEDLRRNRFAETLRLEQERVSYTHLKAALAAWT
jgi:hypothetical protein